MIRWLKKPNRAEIAKYVECYWFLEKLPNAEGNDYPKLNPDPSAHLILALPKQSFQYKNDNGVTQVEGSHFLHPYGKTYELDHSKPFACIGIKFHVGAPYSLPNLAALQVKTTQTLIDNIDAIYVNDTFLSDGTQLNKIELLALARNAPDDCCEMLDNLCIPWLADTSEDNHSELTRKILPLLAKTSINELGDTLFCSQRTLERSFLKVTRLTLKQCQSMKRLEAILEFLYQREQSEIDWVDIAYQFGFSDQPHLIRYLKKQIGLTPQDYALQRGFTIDVYGGVD
jgi:AraC-like DNA-binding protein